MDYATAQQFLLAQGQPHSSDPEQFLARLSAGKPPIPGQVTTLLLALKVVFKELQRVNTLDRPLVWALYCLANESRYQFDRGQQQGVDWPPLLHEDLQRVAIAVQSIFADNWLGRDSP